MIAAPNNASLLRQAVFLSLFTICYNMLEGLVSVLFGFEDEVLTLFGFGVDSFIETISGAGILLMITRLQRNPLSSRSSGEQLALRITGYAFYALCLVLLLMMGIKWYTGHQPATTFWGVIISIVSLAFMWWLIQAKLKLGKALQSDAITADANCAKVCMYMSLVLLGSSLIYELTHFAYSDVVGSAGILYFSWKEGRECFEKAAGKTCSDQCCH